MTDLFAIIEDLELRLYDLDFEDGQSASDKIIDALKNGANVNEENGGDYGDYTTLNYTPLEVVSSTRGLVVYPENCSPPYTNPYPIRMDHFYDVIQRKIDIMKLLIDNGAYLPEHKFYNCPPIPTHYIDPHWPFWYESDEDDKNFLCWLDDDKYKDKTELDGVSHINYIDLLDTTTLKKSFNNALWERRKYAVMFFSSISRNRAKKHRTKMLRKISGSVSKIIVEFL